MVGRAGQARGLDGVVSMEHGVEAEQLVAEAEPEAEETSATHLALRSVANGSLGCGEP